MASLELVSYSDESETEGRVFCVAGYVAPATEWAALTEPWNSALEKNAIAEVKMSALQGLDKTQEDFISLITAANLHGFVTLIDLEPYNDAMDEINKKRAPGYGKPYQLAFQHQMELVATYPAIQRLSADERVRFVFDEQKEHQGRAKTLYETVQQSELLKPWTVRLGGLEFADSRSHPGLQAADALAFEARRHFVENGFDLGGHSQRWQWQALSHAPGMVVRGFNRAALAALLQLLPDLPTPTRNSYGATDSTPNRTHPRE